MRIKEIRERNHIKQKDLAKKLGILPTTLYKYESGINKPSYKTLAKMAEILNTSVDALLGINSNIFDFDKLSNTEKQLINLILDFDKDAQQKALGYLLRLKEEIDERKINLN